MVWHDDEWTPIVSKKRRAREPVEVDFDIAGGSMAYDLFITKLRRDLPDPKGDHDKVMTRPVLAWEQRGRKNYRWMHINILEGRTRIITLAVRDHNVYLIGFKNKKGDWYEFGIDKVSNKSLFPDGVSSKFLGCDVSYGSMIGDRKRLKDVDLRKSSVVEAVHRLSNYAHEDEARASARRDLARLIVVVCEAARMSPHYVRAHRGWQDDAPTTLDIKEVAQVVMWKHMSQALLEWRWCTVHRQEYRWPSAMTGVENADAALGVVQLLLRRELWWWTEKLQDGRLVLVERSPPFPMEGQSSPEDGKPPQHHPGLKGQGPRQLGPHSGRTTTTTHHGKCSYAVHAHGQPLIEVIAVRADFPVIGTIAVFDGKRGQIIYKQPDKVDALNTYTLQQGNNDLVLTGPYKGISAHGIVSIEVDSFFTTDDNDSSDDNSPMLLWDPYATAKHVEKDGHQGCHVLTRTIKSRSHGSLDVTYAVLSNAVEAAVQVKLLLAENGDAPADCILVHGTITARSQEIKEESVLFSRTPQEKVTVSPNYLVPLARSLLAVPLGKPLHIKIEASLEASFKQTEVNVNLSDTLEFHPRISAEQVQRFTIDDSARVEVMVTYGRHTSVY